MSKRNEKPKPRTEAAWMYWTPSLGFSGPVYDSKPKLMPEFGVVLPVTITERIATPRTKGAKKR